MNKNDFLDIIGSQKSPDAGMIAELADLIALFPYFQSAHMLLLRGLKKNDDVRFSAQLRKSALYIADREVLYNFLNEPEVINAEVDDSGQEPAREDIPPAGDMIEPGEPDPVQQIGDNLITDHLVAELPIDEEKAGKVPDIEKPITDETIVDIEKPITDETIVDSSASVTQTIVLQSDVDDIAGILKTEDETALLELDTENCETEVIDEVPHPEELTQADSDRLSQADLIDRFIIANPRIEPNREKKDVPVEDRSAPIYDQSGFVTETLAGIYIQQGYYSRAIDIFEKLALKFPEKSSYFAAQIEKVKEYLKK